MTTARRLDRTCLGVCLLSIVLFAVASGQGILLALGLGGVIAARLATGPFPGGRALPTVVISMLVIGIAGFFGMRAWAGTFDVELFSQFMISLMVVKVCDRKRIRDVAQLLSLGVFLSIGALLTSSMLWVGLLLVCILPLVLSATMQYQVASVETRGVHGAESPQPPAMRRSIRRLSAGVAVLGLIMAGVVFVLLPRGIGERAFGQIGAAGIGRTVGFNDEVNLGTGGLISDSPVPVLDLEVIDRNGRQLGRQGRAWYLRGAVLDIYHNGSWRSSAGGLADIRVQLRAHSPWMVGGSTSRPRQEWTAEQRITLRNTKGTHTPLFSSWEPLLIEVSQPSTLLIGPEISTMRILQHKGMLSYTVRSRAVMTGLEFAVPQDTPRVRLGRFDDQRVAGKARQVLDDAGTDPDPVQRPVSEDSAAARAIEQHLRSRYAYTLSPQAVPSGRDPIWWFLDEAKQGHCEYFASAMTAMCRSVGIPARVVTGYVATDFNEITGQYVVRQSNAHAWVEAQVVPPRIDLRTGHVRTPGVWRVYDPTPPGEFRALHQPPPTWRTRITHLIESVEHAWIKNVVSYNSTSQDALLGRWSGGSLLSSVDARLSRAVRSGDRRAISRTTLFAFGGMVSAALVWWLLVEVIGPRFAKRVRRLWTRLDPAGLFGSRPRRSLTILNQRLLDVLERAGHAKPAWRPLLEHVRTDAVVRSVPESVETAARGLNRAHFSGRELQQEDIELIRAAVIEAEQGV